MTDDQVSGEFRFDVTGNGIKRLESLTALLQSVNKIALVSVRRTNSVSTALNKETLAIRNATNAYRVYTNAINKAAKAHLDLKKAAGGAVATPGNVVPTPTVTPTAPVPKAVSPELAAERALNAEIAKGIRDAEKLNRDYHAKQRRDAAESARIQERLARDASSFLAKEDAKRAASSKASAAAQERAAREASREAIAEAEAITRARTRQLAQESKARAAALRADKQWADGLSNTRYALYDVSRTATMAALAMGAMVAVPAVMAAKYEKAFASVARTVGLTGNSVRELQQQFEDLSSEIPTSFEELAQIGTLAGQLDIPAQSVADFTKVVAEFSATTNVGVEEAATNLGRVAQLTGTAANRYANLGSAIYQVGVTSVATESEILDMASQIATAGDLAGFSNTQIIALSGALASLGVQPEAARGSLQRIFNIIENGATTSTQATKALTEATGMSIEQMKELWKQGDTGSQQVFSAFVDGLRKMQEQGVNTTNFLKDMGINAVRDQRLIQVLANNTQVYTQALENSSSAYADGSQLADAYAKQTDNVADNFARLVNTLTAFVAEMGDSNGALNDVVKGVTELARMWLDLSRNPVISFLTKVVGGMLLLGAGIATTVAISTKLRGAMYSLVTSSIGVQATQEKLTFGFGALSRELAITTKQFVTGTLTASTFGQTIGRTAQSTNALTASLEANSAAGAASGAGAKQAAVGILGGVASFAKFNIIVLGVTAALEMLNRIWQKFTETPTDRANAFFGTGDTSSIVEGLKKDQAEYKKTGDFIRDLGTAQEQAASATNPWAQELQNAASGQDALGTATESATGKINEQRIVLGKYTAEAMAQLVATNPKIIQSWQDFGKGLVAVGFDLREYMKQLGAGTGEAYIQGIRDKINAESARIALAQSEISYTPEQAAADQQRKKALEEALQGLTAFGNGAEAVEVQLKNSAAGADIYNRILGTTGSTAQQTKAQLNDMFAGLSDDTTSLSDDFSKIRSSIMAPYEAADSWNKLGQSIAENGKQFDGFGEKAKNNISAVMDVLAELQSQAGNDTTKFGEGVLTTMIELQKQGISTGGSLSFLGDILNSTLGGTYNLDFNSSDAQQSIVSVIDAAIAAQHAIMTLQAAAISNAQAALAIGYSAAKASALYAAQSQYNAAAAQAASLEALRAAAMKAAAAAQKNLNSGIAQGTKNLNKNSGASKKNADANKKAARSIRDWVSDLRQVMDVADEFRWGVEDAWRAVQKAQADAVKTMVETVWNISDAYDKAFRDINYKDSLTTALYDMQEQAQDAADAVVKAVNDIKAAQADLAGIGSDRTNLMYGLDVANLYGDALRAQSIRAKLAELDAKEAAAATDLANAQRDLADAQASQDKSLTGNSKQAIENRKTMQDLVGIYADYIKKLADGGASTEEIAAAVAQAQADFLAQAQAMGFAGSELTTYSDLFAKFAGTTTVSAGDSEDAVRDLYNAWEDYILQLVQSGASQDKINAAIAAGKKAVQDLASQMGLAPSQIQKYISAFNGIDKIIDKIPKNITTKLGADTDPAEKAIKEFIAKNSDGKGLSSGGVQVPMTVKYNTSGEPSGAKLAKQQAYAMFQAAIKNFTYFMNHGGDAPTAGNLAKAKRMKADIEYWKDKYNSYDVGGFTGRGAKKKIAGVVHKGEYVFKKSEVNQSTGKPYLMEAVSNNTYNNSRMPSVIMVELSPTDRALLTASGGDLIVQIDGKQVAAAVNNSNKNSSVRGSQ